MGLGLRGLCEKREGEKRAVGDSTCSEKVMGMGRGIPADQMENKRMEGMLSECHGFDG
jgi:hypothetical protein